ncbi:MAG: MBL fold metallo-hydrolase [Saprospiraceae bacterium]|uniref:MBL fold metallo-hydrolase n=1 Tax=Candidatus Opimibacter skivensis TaxID=2982028 RepID=A0A9D7ST32_9BACT|nr:MBL fold metallo-hydrolase [Candidatus Opimibacter skivensis]
MNIKFCGAARHVTGSCHLLTLANGHKVLLDCGLFQGSYNEDLVANNEFLFDPSEINCVILSHAHMDHSGRLPLLVKRGFKGNIHSTHATRSLCAIMLLDGAFIQEKDAEYYNRKHQGRQGDPEFKMQEPLYTTTDVDQTMNMFMGYPYDQWQQVCPGLRVMYTDAGHILGSASVTLEIDENGKKTIFGFTGDIGRPNRPILRDPEQMPACDYLICESTYGDRKHESLPNEMGRFLEIIRHTCIDKKGKLIIPAFSIGRTQEIVYMLDQASNAHQLPPIKVYVDSPLAVNATTIFGAHPECFDNELSKYILKDDNPFGFNDLIYIRDVEQSKALNTSKEPCIIISASGMMNAGRVKHHLANNIEDNKNTILIVGYCTPDTPGGILRAGVKTIKLYGQVKTVRAQIEIMDSFSAHGDRDEMKDFIQNQKPGLKKLFLVHGEYPTQQSWRNYLTQDGFKNIEIPEKGSVVEL